MLKRVQIDEYDGIGEQNWSMPQGLCKIVARDTCLPQNACKCSNCDLFVKRHDANFVFTPQRYMAAALPGLAKSNSLERPDDLAP